MLQLRLTASLEVLDASVGCEPVCWLAWGAFLIEMPSLHS